MITTIFILSRALLSVESRPHHIRGILQQQQQQFSHFTLPHVLEEASERIQPHTRNPIEALETVFKVQLPGRN